MRRTRYDVFTYDVEKSKFTPQVGLAKGPFTLFGLRAVIRQLQDMGYPCDRGDPSVLIERRGRLPREKKPTLGWLYLRRIEQERQQADDQLIGAGI